LGALSAELFVTALAAGVLPVGVASTSAVLSIP
jgi:hypothetical protein